MWIILNNKDATWVFQKQVFQKKGCCSLQKQSYETMEHLTTLLSFTKLVWKELEVMVWLKVSGNEEVQKKPSNICTSKMIQITSNPFPQT